MQNVIDLISDTYRNNNQSFMVGYSGGKDSTLLLQLVIDSLIQLNENGEITKKTYVISSDTLIENPVVTICLDKFEKFSESDLANELQIEFIRVEPTMTQSFWVSVIGKGYPLPTNSFRWCTRNLKIIPMNLAVDELLETTENGILNTIGTRFSESAPRRAKMMKNVIDKEACLFKNVESDHSDIFAPVCHVKIIDLWKHLVATGDTHWGIDSKWLYEEYSMSSGTCPVASEVTEEEMIEKCGDSRWGCWMCPLSDKIWIDNVPGEDLAQMANLRKEIMNERDNIIHRNFTPSRYSGVKKTFSILTPRLRKVTHYLEDGVVTIPKKGSRETIHYNIEDAVEISSKETLIGQAMDYKNLYIMNGEYYIKSPASYTLEYRRKLLSRLKDLNENLSNIEVISEKELNECNVLLNKYEEVVNNG